MKFNKFINQYPLSKTLRFELKPVNETADYIEHYGSEYLKSVVKQDESRYDDYLKMKLLIDDLHRNFISTRLGYDLNGILGHPRDTNDGSEVLDVDDMQNAFDIYISTKKKYENPSQAENAKKKWINHQIELRRKLVKVFKDAKHLFDGKLFSTLLPDFLAEDGRWDDNQELVTSFNKFATYFTGFHENRKNMYAADDKATSIANRSINENLPTFFENILVYQKIIASKQHAAAIALKLDPMLLKRLNVISLDEVFTPEFYLKLFSQQGIEAFDCLLGGIKSAQGESVDGLNQLINEYRQQYNKMHDDQILTRRNFPFMQRLYKQILAETTSVSFSYEPYQDDQTMLSELKKLVAEFNQHNGFFKGLRKTASYLKTSDASQVYLRSNALNILSSQWLGNHAILPKAFEHYINTAAGLTSKKDKEKQLKLIESGSKSAALFSLAEIQSRLDAYMQTQDEDSNAFITLAMELRGATVAEYFSKALEDGLRAANTQSKSLDELEKQLKPILNLEQINSNRRPPKTQGDDDLGGDGFAQVTAIQQYLEVCLNLLNLYKPLHLIHKRKLLEAPENQDKGFYNEFAELFSLMSDGLYTVYNKTRNQLTKKPFKTDKFKINFGKPTLLNGWDANKESDNSCVLFEKAGNYYLGVMHPRHCQLFDYRVGINDQGNSKMLEKKHTLKARLSGDESDYKKIVYKLIPGVNKMLPKVFFSKSRIDFFAPNDNVMRVRNTASHSKNGTPQTGFAKADFNLTDCHALIDFFKQSIDKHFEWRQFQFKFSPTQTYNDISEFYKELQDQAYRIEFDWIKTSYIDQCVADGKLFLFQIYNKDFSPDSTGTPNLHTLYWRGLFERENLQDVVLKLNGEAEMFFRRHSIKKSERIIHQANQPIERKNVKIEGQISQFKHDIVKDKRYTQDKFFLHVPITLNYKANSVSKVKFNDKINQAITQNTHVIGIDRGERHLLYYCLIDPQGNIIQQGSLNEITPVNSEHSINYQSKLHEREKQRDSARKSWTSVENIKELKQGYLSQVVHKITHLMVEYNAIVCLEDLSFGFKKGRFKVEKQVYQKFEKALIDKLNYWVDKQIQGPSQSGHYLRGLQLTEAFTSFEKMGKQSGALYYVNAAYTSKICPVTGFVNLLKPYYKSIEKSKGFLGQFESIRFNGSDFEFCFDYKKTNPDAKLKGSQTLWTATSHGERIVGQKDQQDHWSHSDRNPTKELQNALNQAGIAWNSGDNLLPIVLQQETKEFFKSFLWGLRLTLQMRNSRPNSTKANDDYLISPIADETGAYYDSRHASSQLPKDADANGAYHIALKGLWNIEQIINHDWQVDKPKRVNLAMSNEKWFEFVQNKPYR